MERVEYNQPQISVDDIVAMLEKRGLGFRNEEKAKHLLNNISYFRMKSYLKPLVKDRNTGMFKDGVFFEDAYNLYKFDSALRKFIGAELEKIEVSLRTRISHEMSNTYSSYWFKDSSLFRNQSKHTVILNSMNAELQRSDEEQILDFLNKYSNPFPPSWMTMEITSFGTLSMLYKWFNGGRDRRSVARYYGVADGVLESWLHCFVYVRNLCAHHSRLWNRSLRIAAIYPRRTDFPFISHNVQNDRVYYVICVIKYMLQTINPQNTFTERLKDLLEKYPSADPRAMGFPENWSEDIFWH